MVSLQRGLPRGAVIDHRMRVAVARSDSGGGQDRLGGGPGLVHKRLGQGGQFGDPAAHVLAGLVKLLALGHRVENPEVGRRIRAAAGDPLPTARIAGQVGVHQRIPKPLCADSPVLKQVFA